MSAIDDVSILVNVSYDDSSLADQTPEDSNLVLFVLWGVILPLIATAGLVGNILTIIVLWRREMHSTTIMYLRGMVITDTGILIGSVITLTPLSCANYLHGGALEYFRNMVYPSIHTPGYYLIMTLQQCNVWITVSVSMERYIAICHPFRAARIITRRKTIAVLVSIVIISLIYNIPHLFATRARPCFSPLATTPPEEAQITAVANVDDIYRVHLSSTPTTPVYFETGPPTEAFLSDCFEVTPTDFGKTRVYNTYRTIMYSIIIYVIPFLALVILNSFLIKELMTMQRRRSGTNIHDENEANLSLVLVLIVIVFIFCQTPGLVSQFDLIHNSAFITWLAVSNVLFTMNSAVNFLIYTAFGRKFRRVLLRVFRHIFKKNRRPSQSSCRVTQYTIGENDTFESPTANCSSLGFTSCYRKDSKATGNASENIPLNTGTDTSKVTFNGIVQNSKHNNGTKRSHYTTCDEEAERDGVDSSGKMETVSLMRKEKSDGINDTGKTKSQMSDNGVPSCDDEVTTKECSASRLEQYDIAKINNEHATGDLVQPYSNLVHCCPDGDVCSNEECSRKHSC